MIRRALSLSIAVLLAATVSSIAPRPAVAASSFSDIGGSQFYTDIIWLADQGVTNGCGDGKFCPNDVVTRDQMASFLVRMFRLPATATDYFSDDAYTMHQANINALAASGITLGCGPSVFCPANVVTREQMASFLGRAAGMPTTSSDYFLDDEVSPHRADINRFAAWGVTKGCGAYRFCPSESVTREQMAAFLHRLGTNDRNAPSALPNGASLPACTYGDQATPHADYADWGRTLVDTNYKLPAGYAPGDLVSTANAGINGGFLLRSLAIDDLAAMASAARSAGVVVAVDSAYRSYAQQQSTFNYYVGLLGYNAALLRAARPGYSEHQLGTAIDLVDNSGAYAWVGANGWRYGWVLSYPSGQTGNSCYQYEPWHFRYVGRWAAALIHDANPASPRIYFWRMQ